MLKLKDFVNKKIIIRHKGESKEYISSIQDVESDYISIAVPLYQRLPVGLSEGDEIEIKLYSQDEVYVLEHIVKGKKEDNISLYTISQPQKVKRIQQRNFVRMQVVLTVEYKEQKDESFSIGKTIDISGGGMKLAVSSLLEPGTILNLKFSLPNNSAFINTTARIIRNEIIEVRGGKLKCMGLKFLNLPEVTIDQIVSFVFSKLAEQRRLR